MIPNPFELCPKIPENLEKAVENVIAKSEEVNYDPENDTNWMDLPKEMKKEIVERMDFLSRNNLGATSKDKKTLTESKKYRLNSLEISHSSWHKCSIRAYNLVGYRLVREEISLKKEPLDGDWLMERTTEILKKCEIKSFAFVSHGSLRGFPMKTLKNQLTEFGFSQFERFVCSEAWDFNMFMLRNCTNLQSIAIDAFRLDPRQLYDYKDVFGLPAVRGAKHLECVNFGNLEFLHSIVQNWIESDAEIDKSMEVMMEEAGMINSFAEKFQGNIAEKTDERVRIRMEDQSKQILIQKLVNHNHIIGNFLIKVIPTGLPESEFMTVPFDKYKYSMPRFHLFLHYDAPKLPN